MLKPVFLCAAVAAAPLFVHTASAGQSPAGANFNPDISLILDGRYVSYGNSSDYELPGFMLGGEAGRAEQGLQLGHNELAISANIDDLFFGKLTTAIADHEGETLVELEEAYIETVGLGQGLTFRAGRSLSGIGYLNGQHGHAWDFADAPLVYDGLFGGQLMEDGLRLSWVAPTDIYLQLGAELGRGERFPAGGAANDGKGSRSLFLKLGGDVGASHAWQLGLSHWQAEVAGRSGAGHSHGTTAVDPPAFSGDSRVDGIDLVWKWAPDGNPHERNLKLQAEYFIRHEAGVIADAVDSSDYSGRQCGWYAQAVYQFMPRWRFGLRYDRLSADNEGADMLVLGEAGLDPEGHTPSRSTLMLDYSRSEYSRIRLQFARDDSYEDGDKLFVLQYIMSLGPHGAHQF